MTATTEARVAQSINGLFVEGDILVQIQDASGNYGKVIGPISPVKMTINSGDSTTKERKLRLRGLSGQVANSVPLESGTPTFAFETDDAGHNLILPALRASSETVNESGSSVTDGVTTVPFLGSWLELPHRNIAVTGFAGKKANDTPLVSGTDYVLQDIWLQYGRVWIPETSAIVADEGCKWTYTYGDVGGSRVLGNQLSQVRMIIEMFGVNTAAKPGDPKDIYLKIKEGTISKGSELDFAATDYFKPNFGGTMATPSGETSPYIVEFLTFA